MQNFCEQGKSLLVSQGKNLYIATLDSSDEQLHHPFRPFLIVKHFKLWSFELEPTVSFDA